MLSDKTEQVRKHETEHQEKEKARTAESVKELKQKIVIQSVSSLHDILLVPEHIT